VASVAADVRSDLQTAESRNALVLQSRSLCQRFGFRAETFKHLWLLLASTRKGKKFVLLF
jgi:uncharacterized protein YajQ (UPF0234 family)